MAANRQVHVQQYHININSPDLPETPEAINFEAKRCKLFESNTAIRIHRNRDFVNNSLAKHGWLPDQRNGSVVRCFSCSAEADFSESLMDTHTKHRPRCCMIPGNETAFDGTTLPNVPMPRRVLRARRGAAEQLPQRDNARYRPEQEQGADDLDVPVDPHRHRPQQEQNATDLDFHVDPLRNPPGALFEQYSTSRKRKLTYNYRGCPQHLKTERVSRELSECGFFYVGHRDIVLCYFCGLAVCAWPRRSGDVDSKEVHARFRPDCQYLQNRDPQYVRRRQRELQVVGARA